jgi:hypothetical protein
MIQESLKVAFVQAGGQMREQPGERFRKVKRGMPPPVKVGWAAYSQA